MANGLDSQLMLAKETTYGTAVTVSKTVEFAGDPAVKYTPQRIESKTLRSGGRFGLAGKSPIVFRSGGSSPTFEVASKGQGILWEAALGSAASTLVTGATYQQVFKMADVLPSYTMQYGLPKLDPATGAWTVMPFTMLGSMVKSWELAQANGGILELKLDIDAREVKTTTALAAPSYATGGLVYHFGGACIYSGTIAEPTATTLINTAALTAIANVTSWGVKVDNNLSTGTRRMCGGGLQARPLSGRPKGSGTMVMDYVADTFTAALFADTGFSMVADYVANSADPAVNHLQVLIQDFRLTGDLPAPNDGKALVQSLSFNLFDKAGQTSPIIVINRTTDTAI